MGTNSFRAPPRQQISSGSFVITVSSWVSNGSFGSVVPFWVLGFRVFGFGVVEEVEGVFLRRVGFVGVVWSALTEALGGLGVRNL